MSAETRGGIAAHDPAQGEAATPGAGDPYTPLVSVVVTNHDYGHFLPDCLASVLAQDHPRLDVVVVDDGSTDDSLEVLRAWEGRVRVLARENGGQADALSAGVAAARGDILCLLDADDTWTPDKVSRVVAVFQARPGIGWLRHRLRLCDAALRPYGVPVPAFRGSGPLRQDPWRVLEGLTRTATSAICLRRSAAERVFPLPTRVESADGATSLRYDADALLVALLAAEGVPGWSLDAVLANYRMHEGQQFADPGATTRLMARQAEVSRAVAAAYARRTGAAPRVPTSVHKHAAVVAALEGARPLAPARLGAAAAGWAGALRLLPHSPALAARQAAGLAYAWAMPQRWLRRVLQDPAFTLRPAAAAAASDARRS